MRKKILVALSLIFLTGCFQRDKLDIPQEGEIVTWKQNDHLVVKAKLGPRRIHIPNTHCKKCEAEFYQPEHEHYLGQFPIDYVPEKFPPISQEEATMLPLPYAINQLEFNLMLNGSTVKATDKSFYFGQPLDDINQVKVFVKNEGKINYTTKEVYKKFLEREKGEYEKNISEEYGLFCYSRKDANLWCFGESNNKLISGLSFNFEDNNKIVVQSWEHIYAGVKVYWVFDRSELKNWKKIEAKIWELLDKWNVSPISDSSQ